MDQAIHRSHRHALSENTMSQAETERSPSAMLSGQDLVATVRRCMTDTGSISCLATSAEPIPAQGSIPRAIRRYSSTFAVSLPTASTAFLSSLTLTPNFEAQSRTAEGWSRSMRSAVAYPSTGPETRTRMPYLLGEKGRSV